LSSVLFICLDCIESASFPSGKLSLKDREVLLYFLKKHEFIIIRAVGVRIREA
jgi:hypothetical protein